MRIIFEDEGVFYSVIVCFMQATKGASHKTHQAQSLNHGSLL